MNRSKIVVLLALTVFGCRDLEVPPPPPVPQLAGFIGSLDTQGHFPAGENTVKLVRTDGPGGSTTQTDTDGKFSFGDLGPGMYQIQVNLPGFAPMREGPFASVAGQTTDLGVLKLTWLGSTASEAQMSGVVAVNGVQGSDAGTRPSDAQGATVTFLLERPTGAPVKVNEVTVNAFGTFNARLPPGTYTLEATHPFYLAAKREGVVLGEGEVKDLSAQPLVLDINPAEVLGVVVLEIDKSADAGVGALAEITSDTGRTATADQAGRFSLGGLAAGARTLTFSLPGYHDAQGTRTITLAAAERRDLGEIKLSLDRGEVTGTVEMSDGSALQQVVVDVPGSAGYSTSATASTSTPSKGRFVISGLPVGPYTVRAARPSYVAALSTTISVKANQPVDVGTLRLARIQGDFLIDDGDPTNTPGYTQKLDVTLQLSNVTNAAQYRVASSQADLATATYVPFTTNNIPYTLSPGDEVKTVFLQIKDSANNEGAPLVATVTLDTTAPTGTIELAGGAPFTRVANPLPVTLVASDATSGVAFVRLAAVNDADGGTQLSAPRVAYVRDTTFTRPTSSDGPQTVYAQFIDNAGNVSPVVSATVVIDTVAPTGTITITRGEKASIDGFTNTLLVQLAVAPGGAEPNGGTLFVKLANDASALESAVQTQYSARVAWFLDPQGEGAKTVTYLFVDAAGNQSSSAQATILYDATPPLVTATLRSPTPTNDAGITVQLATVETNPYSADAGLSMSESALFTNAQVTQYPSDGEAKFTLSLLDGVKTVYLRVRDAAGNDGTASVGAELDTTAPSGIGLTLAGALADGTPSSTLTSTSTVTVNLSQAGATRVLLGDASLTSCPQVDVTWRAITGSAVPNHPLPGSGATRTVSACFADGAGNVAGPVSASIGYDPDGPSGCGMQLTGLTAAGLPSGIGKSAQRSVPYSLAGCSEAPLEIAITESAVVSCAANSSGLTWGPYSTTLNELTLSSIDGLKTVRGCVRDAARNTTAFTAAVITLDTTPPTNARVVINGGAPYLNAQALDAGVAVVTVLGTAVGATQWAVEEEGTTPTNFVDYLTQNPRLLALSAGDGVKGVRALFRDDVGNTTVAEVADAIEVDTSAPTLTSLTLVGALADGTQSTATTVNAEVIANLVQTGATTVFAGGASVTTCPASGHEALTGSSTRVTLTGTGTTRTVKACVGDAAGNLSPVLTASIDLDAVGPSGCALVLTGLRADDAQPTTGGAAGKTGRRDVRFSLTSCNEVPLEVALTEGTVSCTAAASLNWTSYNVAGSNTLTLSALDGAKTVRGCVRDAAHNTAAVTAATLTLDTTPPAVTSVTIDSGSRWVNAAQKAARGGVNQVSVGAVAPGAAEWALAEGATPTVFTDFATTNPRNFTFSSPGDGQKTVGALFRDDVGNTTFTPSTASIEFDTVAPSLTSITLAGPLADTMLSEDRTTSTSVWVSVIQNGASGLALSTTALTTCAGASFAGYSSGQVQTTLGATGNPRTVWACVSDAAGNTAGPVQDSIVVDPTGPTGCTLVLAGKRADGTATALEKSALRDVDFVFSGCSEVPAEVFLTEAATVTCTATASQAWRPFDGTPGTYTVSAVDGLKTVRGCVRDAARSVSSFVVDTITLDTTPPTGAQVSIKGGAAWFNAADFLANTPDSNAMPVTGTASGATEWALAELGAPSTFVAFSSPATSTFTFSAGEGTRSIRALFRDDVGNVTSTESTDSIDVDLTPPVLSGVSMNGTLADGTTSPTNTTSASVQVSFSQTGATQAVLVDNAVTTCPTTGLQALSGTMSMTLPGTGAVRTVKACVADAAGNSAGPTLAGTITIDAVNPSGCSLVLVGKNVDGSATGGATVNKTAQLDVGVALSGCTETPTELFLTESATVTCTAAAALDWRPVSGATFTLSSVDGLKTVRGCVRDGSRNVDSLVADGITLDTTAPSNVSVVLKGDAAYFNGVDFLANTPDSNTMAVTGVATGASEWALAEGAAPTNWAAFSSPASTTFAISALDGTKTIRALFRDDVGNVSAEAVDSIIVDTAVPTLTSLVLQGTLGDGNSSTVLTTTLEVTGQLVHTGGTQVFFGDASLVTCPASGYQPLSGNLANTTLTGSGTTRTVKACIADAAGNLAGPATDTIDLDATPPGGCALTLGGRKVDGSSTTGVSADRTALREVSFSLSCPEGLEVFLTEDATVSCNSSTPHDYAALGAGLYFTLSAVDGAKTVRGCVRDASLNVSAIVADAITLDTTPPQGASVVIKGGAAYFNGADFLANTPDSNTAAVTGSAIGATEWALAEGAVPSSWAAFTSPSTTTTHLFSVGDGTKTIRALFRDDVGNVTAAELTDTIVVDTAPPTLTSIALTGTLADGLPSTTNTSTTQVTMALVHVDGTQVLTGDATLAACPASGYSPLAGASATVTLGGSGVTRTVRACIADAAGNTAGPAADTIELDSATPSGCALTLVGKRVDGTATSGATADRTAQLDVTMTLSGCAEAPVEIAATEAATVNCTPTTSLAWQPLTAGAALLTLSSGDGAKTVRGCVRDLARNVSSFVADAITLDTTPPSAASVVLKGGAAYFNNADFVAATPDSNTINVTGTATGASEWAIADGVTPTTWTTFTSPQTTPLLFSAGEGTRTVKARFRDEVGNEFAVELSDSIEVDTGVPTVTALALTGTLADGTPSTTTTNTEAVTAAVTQTGATLVYFGDSTLVTCPASGYSSFDGTNAPLTLPGTGGTRTVKACVSDAAGNVAGPVTDALDFDDTAASGCQLALVGRRVDGTNTSGATVDKTALRDVGITLTSCSDASTTEIFVTEALSVTCSAVNSFAWVPLNASTALTLSAGDGTKTVRGCLRDAARNTASFIADAVSLDTAPPTNPSVSIRGGAAYFNRTDWLANTPDSNTMSVAGTATTAVDWALAEAATPSVFTALATTNPTAFAFSVGDGTKTIRVLFRDDVGNVTTTEATDTIEVDTVAPTLTSVALTGSTADGLPNTTWTSTTQVTLAVDQSGASGLYVGDGTLVACPASGYSSFSGTSTTINLPGSGTLRTVRACVSDAAGNVAGYTSDTISFDGTSPTGCVLTLGGRRVDGSSTALTAPEKTAKNTVDVSLGSCAETPIEVAFTEQPVVCNNAVSLSWQAWTPGTTTYTLSSLDESKLVRGCVRDAARNVAGLAAPDSITLDTTPPEWTYAYLDYGAQYFNRADWLAAVPPSTNTIRVTGYAYAQSGVAATEWALAEGAAPTSFTAFTDGQSSFFPFSAGDGTKTIRVLFRDDVGNVTPAETTASIVVDTSAPTVSGLEIRGKLGDGNNSTDWTTTPQVTATFAGLADASLVAFGGVGFTCPVNTWQYGNLAGISADATLSGSGTPRTLAACVSDAAGNVAGPVTDTIGFDSSAPASCTLTLVGKYADGNDAAAALNKTALTTVTYTVSCSGAEVPAGIFLTSAPSVSCTANMGGFVPFVTGATFSLEAGDGLKTVRGCVRDSSFNVGALTADTITLDQTAPQSASVSLKSGAAYFNRADYLAAGSTNTISFTGTATGATEWAYGTTAVVGAYGAFTTPQTTSLNFGVGEGTKTVYALFRDDVRNTTPAALIDTITVDTVLPSAPRLLTVDARNRSARLFWEAVTDASGLQGYDLLCDPTDPPTTICAQAASTATDGWVTSLPNKSDRSFAVRAVDNAGNISAASASQTVSVGWRRITVPVSSVYPVKPIDIAVRGNNIFVTYSETDGEWAYTTGTLRVASSNDRGRTWRFSPLDTSFAWSRQTGHIAITDQAVFVATIGSDQDPATAGATDQKGQLRIYSSTDNGTTWTNVSSASLTATTAWARTDGLGIWASGTRARFSYLLFDDTSTRQLNIAWSTNNPASTILQAPFNLSSVFGNASYGNTGGLKACQGNYSTVNMWRDQSSVTVASNLRSLTHYYLPDISVDTAIGEGLVQNATSSTGAGNEVGAFDLACSSLPEAMQAYVVYQPSTSGTAGNQNAIYLRRKATASSSWSYPGATTLRTDADPAYPPQVFAGGRSVYVLYKTTGTGKLQLGESTDEGVTFSQWTTLETGTNRGRSPVMSGENSSDVSIAFTDAAESSLTVLLPAVPSLQLVATARMNTSTLSWPTQTDVDRYQVDTYPPGGATTSNFTSTTAYDVTAPAGRALFHHVRPVDEVGMPGNDGQLWQVSPFTDSLVLGATPNTTPGPTMTAGITAYDNKVALWPPASAVTAAYYPLTVFRSSNSGVSWGATTPSTGAITAARAFAGGGGQMAQFFAFTGTPTTLRYYHYSDLTVGSPTQYIVHSGVPVDFVAAKSTSFNNGFVVAYADFANDLIRFATINTGVNPPTVTLGASIATTAGATIDTVAVVKSESIFGRNLVMWREVTAGTPSTHTIKYSESTNGGASWLASPVTLESGTVGTAGSSYFVGPSTNLVGAGNAAYSVSAHVTEYNASTPSKADNLYLNVTGTDYNNTSGIQDYFSKFYADREKISADAMSAFANDDGLYLLYRAQDTSGSESKMKLAYCVSDCHLQERWTRSLVRVWNSNVGLHGQIAAITVSGTSNASLYDPTIYVMYQEYNGTTRDLRVLRGGVHRRTR